LWQKAEREGERTDPRRMEGGIHPPSHVMGENRNCMQRKAKKPCKWREIFLQHGEWQCTMRRNEKAILLKKEKNRERKSGILPKGAAWGTKKGKLI